MFIKKIFFREYVLVHLSFANNRKLVYWVQLYCFLQTTSLSLGGSEYVDNGWYNYNYNDDEFDDDYTVDGADEEDYTDEDSTNDEADEDMSGDDGMYEEDDHDDIYDEANNL